MKLKCGDCGSEEISMWVELQCEDCGLMKIHVECDNCGAKYDR